MDYVEAWQKMRELDKKSADKSFVSVHALNNPYGFKININHPYVAKKYENFKKKRGIGRYDMTAELRFEFEQIFMNSNYYKKIEKQEQEHFGVFFPIIQGETK